MNQKIKNVLSVVLAVIISFLITKFAVHNIFATLSEGTRLAIGVISMFVMFVILMFVFSKLFEKL